MKVTVCIVTALLACLSLGIEAQSRFWVPLRSHTALPKSGAFRELAADQFKTFHLNRELLRQHLLENCPNENSGKSLTVLVPLPDGSFKPFALVESPCMEPGLMEKFPNIKSYRGHSGPDYLRMAISPHSLNVYILSVKGDVVIEALYYGSEVHYGVYYGHDIPIVAGDQRLRCGTTDQSDPSIMPKALGLHGPEFGRRAGEPVVLRTYRLAVSCTGDWGGSPNLGGGTVEKCIDKINASLAYINAVFERDVAIHFNLVANNDKLIYLDPARDPFPIPNQGRELLGINTEIINRNIGSASYDIGHIYTVGCTDVGGVASLASVCGAGKGAGVTCWYTSDVAYVSQRITCHEMGHQFAAPHTFSNCNGNENIGTAYEPGSGTTIMSYSGLCGPDLNVEPDNAPHPNYFHTHSVQTMILFSRGVGSTGASCGRSSQPGNTYPIPQILIPDGLTLPSRTPFLLKGTAEDAENDALTYTWEQYDAGSYGPALGQPTSTGPLIKSVFPSSNPNRVIPDWVYIYGTQNYNKAEILPFETRKLSFRYTVRDNYPGAGGTAWDYIQLEVDGNSGPFRVTQPNNLGQVVAKNSCFKVKWDVNNTFFEPVKCKKVNILLFKNRNHNDPIVLKSNTDNDGEELVSIPDIEDSRSRICVQAADHIFFDVSDYDFIIRNATIPGYELSVSPNLQRVCAPATVSLDVHTCSSSGQSGTLRMTVAGGLPPDATYWFEKSTLGLNDHTKLILDLSKVRSSGNYSLQVVAEDETGHKITNEVHINVVNVDFSGQEIIYPKDGLSGVPQAVNFIWKKSDNASSYTFELATSPAFGNSIVLRHTGLTDDSLRTPFLLDENKLYYWRIIPVNLCGEGNPTKPSAFHTISKSCNTLIYPGNAVRVFRNETKNMDVFVPNAGNVSDVNIKNLEGTATFVNNIRLTLISPAGTRVLLWNYNCSTSDIFECSFDDEGLVRASVACPPSGKKIIIPLQSLKAFVGEDRRGIWMLEINANNRLANSGSNFISFGLDICSDIILNSPELVINNPLDLNNGQTKSITDQFLLCQDRDNTASELLYTLVTNTIHGDLLLNGAKLIVGSQFTQEDINSGRLQYKHFGSGGKTDGFDFTVIDGQGGWFGTAYFTINVSGVAVKNPILRLNATFYPNPNIGDELNVSWESNSNDAVQVELIDLRGSVLVSQGNIRNNTFRVNIAQLKPGVYFAKLIQGGKSVVEKIVVE